jgi:uroporphyrinogen-III synthase
MPSNHSAETYKEVKSILISQPKPTSKSPYFDLEQKWGLQIDFRQFIHVEPVDGKEFRRQRIKPDDYSAIIFTSRNSIDHFFRICEEARVKMPADTRYFCMTEAVANYLQKFIVYRKRKVTVGKRTIYDLKPGLTKHKKEKFLLPCSNLGAKQVSNFLDDNGFDWQESMMYKTVSSDLSDLSDVTYDILVFFSPLGIHSLYENFPDFKQNETRLAIWGKSTREAVEDHSLSVNIYAPTPNFKSMTMAIEDYLQKSNK